jgi:NAD-specific glutamate dehydrogenase
MGCSALRFDENYALASTQNLKNKDIPEGGAKGTILPSCVSLLFLLLVT